MTSDPALLETGADDYVAKPFSPREVVARVKAVLRRASPPAPSSAQSLRFDGLLINPRARDVRVGYHAVTQRLRHRLVAGSYH